MKERRKCSLRADEDYFVPYAAMTELKESLLSKQNMFFEEMRMMMLAQRELIFELKVQLPNEHVLLFTTTIFRRKFILSRTTCSVLK